MTVKKLFLIATVLFTCLSNTSFAKKTYTGSININTATVSDLAKLPGIGESKAKSIVSYRKLKPFQSKDELMLVKGIGEKLFLQLEKHISLKGSHTLQSQ